ncbi:putative cytochrome P450 alkane hydroxylase [Aspergillus parasiticus]|uniref:Putative cytochrome P450 alkane hydroxylase n=1 Tax=Aspergillus parasiticus TaxID=5067 RepID=A0A5N6E424_ASPPA|nr:putative cytochrome P450 alkane hydroxylase [Aspergillus parasiticus]
MLPWILTAGPISLIVCLHVYLYRSYKQYSRAKSMGCLPPVTLRSDPLGAYDFWYINQAVKEKRWLEYITSQHELHGHTFQFDMFLRSIICTIEPTNVKAILATRFMDFGLGCRHEQFSPFLGNGIFTLDGEAWSHARGLLRPQFTREQVADIDILAHHVTRIIESVPKDRSSFDIQPLCFSFALNSATHFLFGESVDSLDPCLLQASTATGIQGFEEAFDLAQDYLFARSKALGFYWMINPKAFRDATRTVHEVVDHYVRRAIHMRKSSVHGAERTGRYIFLEALAAETQDPNILRDNLLNILLAGRDTTSSLLSSTFYYLARHPRVWRKLRDQVVAHFGTNLEPLADITQTSLKALPYLRYVLNEVLRLLPPIPINFRIAAKDTCLPVGGGPDGNSPVYVNKGAMIFYSVYSMHRRTDIWGQDAHAFRPERWENAKHQWEYLPFNGGPRICLGQQYALTVASYTLVRFMQHFDILQNADPASADNPVLCANLTLSHDQGVMVRLYSSSRT